MKKPGHFRDRAFFKEGELGVALATSASLLSVPQASVLGRCCFAFLDILDNVSVFLVADSLDSHLFGDVRARRAEHYLLSARLVTCCNLDVAIDTIQFFERRTDVFFTAASRDACHFHDVGRHGRLCWCIGGFFCESNRSGHKRKNSGDNRKKFFHCISMVGWI